MNDTAPPQADRILKEKATIPEHVVYRAFEAETLLLNLETSQYHGLNRTGARLLELLKETDGRVPEAIERLAAECSVEPGAIEGDMVTFCAELAERGLIEFAEAPQGSG